MDGGALKGFFLRFSFFVARVYSGYCHLCRFLLFGGGVVPVFRQGAVLLGFFLSRSSVDPPLFREDNPTNGPLLGNKIGILLFSGRCSF